MDSATKADIVMGMLSGVADYRRSTDVCVGCGRTNPVSFAGRARDLDGRWRGICLRCARERQIARGGFSISTEIDYFLDNIRCGNM